MSRVAHTGNRAALKVGCLLAAFAFLFAATHPPAADPAAPDERASASIVNGRSTTIGAWPWQVALTFSRKVAPRRSTTARFFCGGSILAPRLVITAGHCVADLRRSQVRNIEIVSGRTNLDSSRGEVARVSGLRMPVNSSGKRRYRTIMGAADWDVALLTLADPLSSQPIRIAGPDEEPTWKQGSIAWTTGWGNTSGYSDRVPARLQVARQVIMGNGLCRRSDGVAFQATRMLCFGGPGGNASACLGDSGGPLVVQTSDGYRLVGLTSYGDGVCRGTVPSVDTRVAGDPIRRWVARTALGLTGVDVLGSGATALPSPAWCKVPYLFGLKPWQAKQRLLAANCRLGAVRVDPWAPGRRGRIVGASRSWGWLAPAGFRVRVWIAS